MNETPHDAASRPRRKSRALAALIALISTATAGAAIWISIKDDVGRLVATPRVAQAPAPAPKPAAPAPKPATAPGPGPIEAADEIPAGRPIGEDEPAFWSDVAVFKAGPGRTRPIVVVKRGRQPMMREEPYLYQGLLAREVVRQALLLAAREGLGARALDIPIGDPEVPGTPDATFRIGSRFRTMYQAKPDDPAVGRITIVQGDGAGRRVLWSGEFDCAMNIAPTFPKLVAVVERLARDEFPKVLEGLGVARTGPAPPKDAAEGDLPPGVEARLGELAETEAFAAIRALHEAIRTRGETSTRLLALARAYANLGSLAESQWTADYLAFQARALLYARRAVVRDHDAPASLRAQAYVEALAGLTRQAWDDLHQADRADWGQDKPPWAAAIRAYCRSDAGALGRLIKSRPDDPLPRYLRFLVVTSSSGYLFSIDKVCRHEVLAAGHEVLARVPDCFRVHDGIAAAKGFANLRASTTVPLELYAKALPARLARVPGLPPKAAERMADGNLDEVGLRKALVAASADDPSDLTWGVLARQLREIRFLLVCRRYHFLAESREADAAAFAAKALPMVADHPNRAYIECAPEGFDRPDTPRKLQSLDLVDYQSKSRDLVDGLREGFPDLADAVEAIGWEHTNLGTLPGQVERTKNVGNERLWEAAHNLLRFDPDSPLGRGALIASRWEEARPNVEAWEKDHDGGDTFVIAQLGLHAMKEGQYDDAERRLEAALARSPERWIFEGLAEVYRKTGRIDRWKAAADRFLKGEEQDLDHALALLDLADALMRQGRYDQARPYAERAAASGASWAMPVAARCAEEQGDWKAAEVWMSRASQRFAPNWLDWFYWCQRTGRGDARAAAALVEGQVEAGRAPSADEFLPVASVYILVGRPEAARRFAEAAFKGDHEPFAGVWLLWACDLAGDRAVRDAAMKTIAAQTATAPRTARIIGALADWLAQGEKSSPDLKRIDALLEEIPAEYRPDSAGIVGLLLDRHGRKEEAVRYLKLADAGTAEPWFRLLVRAALRARKIEPAAAPPPHG
jgi:tetratricopeptide (TPR) repeat protein